MTEPIALSPGKSDREVATDLHARCKEKLTEIAAILDEANAAGMQINFALGMDGFGRNVIGRLDIVKPLVR